MVWSRRRRIIQKVHNGWYPRPSFFRLRTKILRNPRRWRWCWSSRTTKTVQQNVIDEIFGQTGTTSIREGNSAHYLVTKHIDWHKHIRIAYIAGAKQTEASTSSTRGMADDNESFLLLLSWFVHASCVWLMAASGVGKSHISWRNTIGCRNPYILRWAFDVRDGTGPWKSRTSAYMVVIIVKGRTFSSHLSTNENS